MQPLAPVCVRSRLAEPAQPALVQVVPFACDLSVLRRSELTQHHHGCARNREQVSDLDVGRQAGGAVHLAGHASALSLIGKDRCSHRVRGRRAPDEPQLAPHDRNSIYGEQAAELAFSYSAAKAAVISFTRSAAYELAQYGVRAVARCWCTR